MIPPMYIKEAVLPQEKGQSSSQLSFLQQDHKPDSLDYNIRISQQNSQKSQPLWLHHQSVVHIRSSVLGQHKVLSSLEKIH